MRLDIKFLKDTSLGERKSTDKVTKCRCERYVSKTSSFSLYCGLGFLIFLFCLCVINIFIQQQLIELLSFSDAKMSGSASQHDREKERRKSVSGERQ